MTASSASALVSPPDAVAPEASRGAAAPRRAPARGGRLRNWLAIDERPAWIALAQTALGRAGLFLAAGLLLSISADLPLRAIAVILAGAAAAAFLPAHRDKAVFGATFTALLLEPMWFGDSAFEAYLASGATGSWLSPRNIARCLTVALFALAAVVFWAVARRPEGLLAKRPAACMLATLAALTALYAWISAGAVSLWFVIAIKLLAAYTWFICYTVVDQRAKQRSSRVFSLGLLRPFWGPSSTPIGKGGSYLAKFRSKDGEELAVTQLKAIKLLAWSVVLQGISILLATGAARAGVPELDHAVTQLRQGRPVGIGFGWAALVLAVAIGTIDLAVWGHRVVGCARLAGWRLRRNTWRPLESRSLADFWNRYYYYFKELLLDFFFYPTFFRFFRSRPRLRTFFATFMAAGVGNAIYHFVRDIDRVFSLGPAVALQGFGSYAFYCTALACGIGVSQVRTARAGGAPARRATSAFSFLRSLVCVWGFLVLIHVFGGVEDRTISFGDRVTFLFHQLGIDT